MVVAAPRRVVPTTPELTCRFCGEVIHSPRKNNCGREECQRAAIRDRQEAFRVRRGRGIGRRYELCGSCLRPLGRDARPGQRYHRGFCQRLAASNRATAFWYRGQLGLARVCEICGREFVGGRQSCSDECLAELQHRRGLERTQRPHEVLEERGLAWLGKIGGLYAEGALHGDGAQPHAPAEPGYR